MTGVQVFFSSASVNTFGPFKKIKKSSVWMRSEAAVTHKSHSCSPNFEVLWFGFWFGFVFHFGCTL